MLINVLKYMTITAAAMAVIEAHAFDKPADYKLFNMAVAKTVMESPECFTSNAALMSNMTSEIQAVRAIVDDAEIADAPTLTGLSNEIEAASELSLVTGIPDIITSRCAFLLGQAYGGMAGYFFFNE